ncbi:MAG: hypothetical protein ACU843_04165 [Gammaproteobacteria bacterium]
MFVMLLIVTQMLAPLIHGHGGYAEPIRGFHMPGFENFSRTAQEIAIGSATGLRGAGFELIISVASGIERKSPDGSGLEAQQVFAPNLAVLALAISLPDTLLCPDFPPIPQLAPTWSREHSRAPPQF